MKKRNVNCSLPRLSISEKKLNIVLKEPSFNAIKVTAGSILKSFSGASSPNLKSFKDRLYHKVHSQAKLPYTNWEIFNANQGLKEKKFSQDLKKLRRNFKNPFMYDNEIDVDSHQKSIENCLFRVYNKILKE